MIQMDEFNGVRGAVNAWTVSIFLIKIKLIKL